MTPERFPSGTTRARAAWTLLGIGVVLATLRLAVPALPGAVTAIAIGSLAVAGLAVGAAMISGRPRRVAALFAASVAAGSLAIVVEPGASPATSAIHGALDLAGYLLGITGMVVFARGAAPGDPDSWLDAMTVGIFLSIVLLEFVIDPNGTVPPNPGPDLLSFVVTVIVDVIVLGGIVRFVIRPLASRPISLFGGIVGLVVVLDAVYHGSGSTLDIPRVFYDAAWSVAYAAWGAAVLHPDFDVMITGHVPASGRLAGDLDLRGITRSLGIHMVAKTGSVAVFIFHLLGDGGASGPVFLAGIISQMVISGVRGGRQIRSLGDNIRLRLEAEEDLRRSDARFAELARMAPVGVFISDADGQSTFQNDAWGRIAGHAPSSGPGTGYEAAIHPDDRAMALGAWKTSIASGQPMEVEHRLLRPDGSVRWVQANAVPLRTAQGAVDGWVGTVADVTGLVEARETAVRREAFVNALLEQSPVGIAVYGTDGHLVTVNGAANRIRRAAGVLMDPVDVRTDELMIALGQQDAIQDAFGGLVSGDGRPTRVLSAPDELWVAQRWFPLLDGSSVAAVICFTEDVTAQVRAADEQARVEAKLRETAKLEALGVLAGGIAHDFNNLLVAIMGHAELARSGVEGGTAAAADIEAIGKAAERAADLARQMLAYSGRGSFVVGPVLLDEMIREIGDLLARSIAKSATLAYAFEADLPPVLGDVTQLRQLVLNLIVNASDALEGRPGTIAIRTGWATLAADDPLVVPGTDAQPGRYVSLEVTDTGRGMDALTVGRIFDPFFSTKAAGRGLGLAATIGIVKGHAGAIRLHSTPGEGTTFEVLLPEAVARPLVRASSGSPRAAHAAALDQALAKDAGAKAESRLCVLLVDDEPTVRVIGRRILERSGFRVLEAVDGPEGVEIFEADPAAIDAVLLDLTLPTMDGTVVLDRMRASRPDLPVVICSGWAADEVADRLDTDHRTQFVQKPYQSEALLEALALVLYPDGA